MELKTQLLIERNLFQVRFVVKIVVAATLISSR